jgi:PIN domain nuclease of toxin-antitoxin system
VSIGKYTLNEPFLDFIQHAILDNQFRMLPIEPRHSERLIGLPFHHRDPFDRLLIAQAMVENLPLVTDDADVALYPVTCLW